MTEELDTSTVSLELLERARGGAEQAEVYSAEVDATTVEFRAGRLHRRITGLGGGFGLRVVRSGRIGYAATSDPRKVEETVEAALTAAGWGRIVRFNMPHRAEPSEVKTFDNRVIMLPTERMIEWGRELCEAVKARVPDLKLNLTLHKEYREVTIINSNGLETGYTRAELGVSVEGLLVSDGLYWIWEWRNLSDGRPFPLGELADRLEERARLARRRARLASGRLPVVLEPSALEPLLLPLAVAVNGVEFVKGSSPLIGREDERILDARLTIADNGRRDWGPGSAPVDEEGVPRRRNVLFDGGEFRGFLFDLVTGALAGRTGTGSATRDWDHPPEPGTSNLEVAAGSDSLPAVVAGMKEGLVVQSLLGAGQSDLLAGEVALAIAAGYKVENGQPVGIVKDAMFAGNVYEMLREVMAVGDKPENHGHLFAPFVALPAVTIAARN